jgi:hypothetical protein
MPAEHLLFSDTPSDLPVRRRHDGIHGASEHAPRRLQQLNHLRQNSGVRVSSVNDDGSFAGFLCHASFSSQQL